MNTESYNIVLLPDIAIEKTACAASQQLAQVEQTQFVLDAKQFFPHITLYQAAYPEKSLDTIIAALDKSIGQFNALNITLNSVSNYNEFIFWNAEISPELRALHEQCIQLLNPLRKGVLSEDNTKALEDPRIGDAEKEAIRECGYLLAHNQFQPHITITKLLSTDGIETAVDALQNHVPNTATSPASRLALTTVGEHGTVNHIYKEWALK